MSNAAWRRVGGAGLLAALALAPLALGGCASAGSSAAAEEREKKAHAHLSLAIDHLQNNRVALALRELMTAEQLAPEDPRIQFALAQAYLGKGRTSDCEQHLMRALEFYPEYHDARLSLSALYIHLERYPEAIEQSQALLDDPTYPAPWEALTNLGWAHLKLGHGAEARRHLEEALSQNTSHWPTLLDLGILESQEGHRVEAASLFQRVLQLNPGPSAMAEANYRLAELYVSLGKRKQAVGHLKAAVAETPDGQWGAKSEAYLKLLR